MFAASGGMKHAMAPVYPCSNTLVEMTLGWETDYLVTVLFPFVFISVCDLALLFWNFVNTFTNVI